MAMASEITAEGATLRVAPTETCSMPAFRSTRSAKPTPSAFPVPCAPLAPEAPPAPPDPRTLPLPRFPLIFMRLDLFLGRERAAGRGCNERLGELSACAARIQLQSLLT